MPYPAKTVIQAEEVNLRPTCYYMLYSSALEAHTGTENMLTPVYAGFFRQMCKKIVQENIVSEKVVAIGSVPYPTVRKGKCPWARA